MAEIVANFELENNEISADMELSNDSNIEADFVIYSTGTTWGNISGEITNQTDLSNVLIELQTNIQNEATTRANKDSLLDNDISTINGKINGIEDTLDGLGDIVTHNVNEFATASQGQLAESSLQSGDNISELVNDSEYITNNALSGYATESWVIGQGYTTNVGTVTSVNNTQPDSNGNVTIVLPDTQVQADWNESDSTSKAYIKNKPPIPSSASDVGALPDSTKYGKSIDLTLNTTDYKLTISLKDQDGTVLNSKVVDFPLESVVVSGAYDSVNKKVILTLQNGSTIDFSVADLISGLQTEITSSNKLDSDLVDDTNQTHKFVTTSEKQTWNNKQDNISDLSTIRSGANVGATAVQPSDLSTVATSGSYNDLSDKPTIPSAQIQSDWNQSNNTAVDYIKNKPTIPTVPTNVSAFNNDSGYITSASVDTLTDVTLSNLTNGQGLIYNSTTQKWENQTIQGSVTDVQVNGSSVVTDGVAEIDLTGYQKKLTAGTDMEIVEGSSARLPQGFTEVEYIQCNGDCLIDLGIVTYSTDVIEQKFQNLTSRPSQVTCWFGSMQNPDLIRLSIGYNPQGSTFFGSFNYTTTLSSIDTNIHTIKIYKSGTTFISEFDGIPNKYNPTTLVEPSINSYLFARNGANVNVTYGQNIRIYYHKQTRSGAYILNLVPCRREADGELGFYNLVNNEFLTSSDNTQLSAGADIIFNPSTIINFTNETGYITGIDSADVATALGYTPVNPSSLSTVATSGSYNDLTDKPTIPDVSNFVQSSVEDSSVGISSSISYLEGFAPTMQLNYGNYQFTISTSEGAVMEAVDTSNNNQFAASVMPTGMLLYQGSQQAQLSLSNNNLVVNGNEIATESFVTSQGYAKSVNNIQPDSNGNVTIPTGDNIYIAEYNVTSYSDINTAYNSGKTILCKYVLGNNNVNLYSLVKKDTVNTAYIFSNVIDTLSDKLTINSSNVWSSSGTALAQASELLAKQNTLVSGTNIKTINNTSLLGSGNVAVQSVISDLATIRSGASKGATSVQPSDLSGYEQTSNKVTSLSSSSTNTQYPSAKCVYDEFADSVKYVTSENFYCWYAQGEPIEYVYTTTDTPSVGDLVFRNNGTYYDTIGWTDGNAIELYFYGGHFPRLSSGDIIPFRVNLTDINSHSLNIKQVDGQWVASVSRIADTNGTVAGTSYSLSSYLPNDNNDYLVKVTLYGYDNDSTYAYHINSDIFSTGSTDTSDTTANQWNHIVGGTHARQSINTFDIPVGTGRFLKLYGGGGDNIAITLLGYRRLGTNG